MSKNISIAFKATGGMVSYKTRDPWRDGDIRKVPKDHGEHLINTFPLNFFPAAEYKEQVAAEKDKAESKVNPPKPAGDKTGDTTGTDTSKLTDAEKQLYESAVAKVDTGKELTEAENNILRRVDGPIDDLTPEEIELYDIAIAKKNSDEELTEDETAIIEKVDQGKEPE